MMQRKINRYLFIVFILLVLDNISYCQINFSSKLPLINITTNGQIIVQEDKITANMQVIDHQGNSNSFSDSATFETKIGIELRGQTSLQFSERLPFSVETRKSDGFISDDVKLLGLPKENDWAFIAPYSDKTLIRDAFTYKLAKQIMPWAPSFRFAELVLNNEYEGVYMITEKIKRSKNRVNIDAMNSNENQGDSLTGGYLFSLDKLSKGNNYFYSNISYTGINSYPYYIINYPKPEQITNQQNDYIKTYIQDFEKLMQSNQYNDVSNGYSAKIEVDTFVNFFLINELTKNVDGYRLSTFFKKNRNNINPKLNIASVWDFNIALGNADYCQGNTTSGWAYNFNNYCLSNLYSIPSWLVKLANDVSFKQKMKTRWIELRHNEFKIDRLYSIIDSLKNEIGYEAIARNYARYNILNKKVWPNPQVSGSYEGEITYLKNWLYNRILWIDGQFGYVETAIENVDNESDIIFFPNPASSFIILNSDHDILKVDILDVNGQLIRTHNYLNSKNVEIDIGELKDGLYFIKVLNTKRNYCKKVNKI